MTFASKSCGPSHAARSLNTRKKKEKKKEKKKKKEKQTNLKIPPSGRGLIKDILDKIIFGYC